MQKSEWMPAEDEGEQRTVFLGSVFALYPSGKYYMPFACSNVDLCSACKGYGETYQSRGRRAKKWTKARLKQFELARKRGFIGDVPKLETMSVYRYVRKMRRFMDHWECPLCEGVGSYEALLDEIYRDLLEDEADKHGYTIISGEGDPCDIFVAEYRNLADEVEPVEVDE
jgi:hypothetical protein